MSRMKGTGKSDGLIVPKKPTNNEELRKQLTAESVEGRRPAKGKSAQGNPRTTQNRIRSGLTGLRRVRERASQQKEGQFTNLYSHLQADLLKTVFYRLKRKSAPGVDGTTWQEYEEGLENRLEDLTARLHRLGYHPLPVRRTYIPKADGRQRPLGIPSIEDKVVQGAVVALLTPIYEAEFSDCSYGFRPKRNQHMALKAIDRMLYGGRVNWVLDADIRGYFDAIDHERLMELVERRVGDKRLLRLIRRWLKAGIMEDGNFRASTEGTPQGGLVSPLLANVYLHYVLDDWTEQDARRRAGTMHLVRYSDDFLVGFQRYGEAQDYLRKLNARMTEWGLQLHPEKTKLIRFGQFARKDSVQDGRRRPETFDFLGFTHYCGRGWRGGFIVGRRTSKKKRKIKLQELKEEIRRRMHWPVKAQWRWLNSVLRGHYQYYAVPTNYKALKTFRYRVLQMWHRGLQRRSQRAKKTRAQLEAHDRKYPLPLPHIIRRSYQCSLNL